VGAASSASTGRMHSANAKIANAARKGLSTDSFMV
jgi:hypothetical protein